MFLLSLSGRVRGLIYIYVDGGFDPEQPSCDNADSCNAAWAIAVIAVDELMQGKLMGSSGGHVTFKDNFTKF